MGQSGYARVCHADEEPPKATPFFVSGTVALPEDSYGWIMLKVLSTFDKTHNNYYWFNVAGAVVIYFIVLFMQCVIIGFLLLSAERMESTMENSFFDKNYNMTVTDAMHALRKAAESGTPLSPEPHDPMRCAVGGGESILCQCAEQLKVQLPVFYYVMMFFWVSTMVGEVKAAYWWILNIYGVKTRSENEALTSHKCKVEGNGDTLDTLNVVIESLDNWLRFCLMLFLPGVQICLAFLLTYAGSKFLILQTNQAKLVMKVLCMKFVLDIDQILIKSFLSKTALAELKDAKMKTVYARPHRDNPGERFWSMFLCGVIIVAVVLVEMWGFFGPLMHFRHNCRLYRAEFNVTSLPTRMSPELMVQEIFA